MTLSFEKSPSATTLPTTRIVEHRLIFSELVSDSQNGVRKMNGYIFIESRVNKKWETVNEYSHPMFSAVESPDHLASQECDSKFKT